MVLQPEKKLVLGGIGREMCAAIPGLKSTRQVIGLHDQRFLSAKNITIIHHFDIAHNALCIGRQEETPWSNKQNGVLDLKMPFSPLSKSLCSFLREEARKKMI